MGFVGRRFFMWVSWKVVWAVGLVLTPHTQGPIPGTLVVSH